jgi:hypothetical protein
VLTPAELFVAVLGASNFTYVEALPSQELPHWITGHVHTFEYLQGVPEIVVCDNLKSGVTRAHRYEPDINATYLEMAAHYGCAVIPARAGKPRDKAKVEAGVLTPSAGSWPACATARSSRSPRPTAPSGRGWISSTDDLSRSWRGPDRACSRT